jgi:hypothetical protein
LATLCQQLFIGTSKHKTHFKISKLWRIFIYFLNQRFGGHLGRYLVLMETKPKKLNKSLWNEDGLPKYSLWLVMPNLGLWDLTTIIPNQVHHPKGSDWVGLGWVESCKQPCQTYYLFCKVYYLPQRNLTSHNCE